jgi:hypothetical protein
MPLAEDRARLFQYARFFEEEAVKLEGRVRGLHASASTAEAWPVATRPLRIARSAIDDNVPSSDLYVTPSHALYLDGVLVPAGDLVNGTTIAVDDADELDVIEYFHIMFEQHDVVDAQGVICESLLKLSDTMPAGASFVSARGVPLECIRE